MSISRIEVATAFVQTRMAHRRLRNRADIARHQSRLWGRLATVLARTPALSANAGKPLNTFLIVDPGEIRLRLEDWNSLALNADEISAGADTAERGGDGSVRSGVYAGYSTGTTGTRGVFLSSKTERARYLGQSLAKLLPDPPLRRRRIGLCLRANNALYRDVANTGPFAFRFFALDTPALERARDIAAFGPDIMIAPSHVLAELAGLAANGQFSAPPIERLFYGAEPMGAAERVLITEALGARPDPIYQATEGFLGSACRHGVLHLNEDSIIFEFEQIKGSDRFRPIVTDLRRTSQPIVRVRLDDIVQFRKEPCPCGSALLAIHPVEGRVTDIWRWDEVCIVPRQVEDLVSGVVGASNDWRATASPAGVRLACNAPEVSRACAALRNFLESSGADKPVTVEPLVPQRFPKRRRVQWIDA